MEVKSNIENFEFSSYLIALSKIRRKKFNFSFIKKKLSISDYQLDLLEQGIFNFLPFPYNYHITKQYVEIVAPSDIFKIKEEMFSKAQQLNGTSNDRQNTGEYVYTNLFAKLWKIIILSIFVIN